MLLKIISPVSFCFFYMAIRKFYIAYIAHICSLHYISLEQHWSKAFSSVARVLYCA